MTGEPINYKMGYYGFWPYFTGTHFYPTPLTTAGYSVDYLDKDKRIKELEEENVKLRKKLERVKKLLDG